MGMNRRTFIARATALLAVGGSVQAGWPNGDGIDDQGIPCCNDKDMHGVRVWDGSDTPSVYIDSQSRPAEMFNYDIVDKNGESVPNVVSAINEVQGWIEMYTLKMPGGKYGYEPVRYYDHEYRIVGLSRNDRIKHNELFGKPFSSLHDPQYFGRVPLEPNS